MRKGFLLCVMLLMTSTVVVNAETQQNATTNVQSTTSTIQQNKNTQQTGQNNSNADNSVSNVPKDKQNTGVDTTQETPIKNGLVLVNQKYGYYNNDKLQEQLNGIKRIDDKLYYFQNGYVDSTYTNLVYFEDIWYYVKNGVVDNKQTAMAQVNNDGVYYYVVNSKISWDTTELIYYNNKWYYIVGGQFQSNYTGLVRHVGTLYYVENGHITWQYSGVGEFEGKRYYVENSQVKNNFNGSARYNNETIHFTNSVENTIKILPLNHVNGTSIVQVPSQTGTIFVWSKHNGKDDIVSYTVFNGQAIVRLSNHRFESGTYQIEYNGNISEVEWQLHSNRPDVQNNLNELRQDFNHLFGHLSGQKSLYITPTDSTEVLSIDNALYKSASSVKLFILAAAHARASRGEIDFNTRYTVKSSDIVAASVKLNGNAGKTYTMYDYAQMMMQYSDNSATNIMIKFVGGVDAVNQEIRRLGYPKTRLERYMRIPSQINAGLENYISAQESADLIKNIYNKTLINPRADETMLANISNNFYNIYLGTYIKDKAEFYDKTGGYFNEGIENDVAIIGKNGIAYALALLTNNVYNVSENIRQFGVKVYEKIETRLHKNGLHQDVDGTWRYYTNGKVDTTFNGLTYYNNTWYNIVNGVLDWDVTDLVYHEGNWYYIQNGQLNWGVDTFAQNKKHGTNSPYYYVRNSTVDFNYVGLAQYPTGDWHYIKHGVTDTSYSGLVMYNGTWYNVNNGILDWSFNGVVLYNGKQFYVENGQITWEYTGSVEFEGVKYYVRNSEVKMIFDDSIANKNSSIPDDLSDQSIRILSFNKVNGSVFIQVPGQNGMISVWSTHNGQDDLVTYPVFNGKSMVRLSNHNLESGQYIIEYNGVQHKEDFQLYHKRSDIQNDLNVLRQDFKELFDHLDGKKSLYITPTDSTELVSVDDKTLYKSASAIKLFVLAAAHARASRGEIDFNTMYTVKQSDVVDSSAISPKSIGKTYNMYTYAQMMIEVSDNSATNIMIDFIGGIDAVNTEIRRLGYPNTRLERYMRIPSQINAGLENYVSSSEATDLIKNIYNKSLFSPNSDSIMLLNLAHNAYHIFLTANITDKAEIYNKPGGYYNTGIENDVVIIKKNDVTYAVTVLTNSASIINDTIRQFGEKVYEKVDERAKQQGYKNGLHQDVDETWRYYTNGTVDTTFNGLTYYNNTWYNIVNGVLDWDVTDLVYHEGNWYYIQNGQLNWGVTEVVSIPNNDIVYYISNSKVDKTFNGLAQHKNGTWYYFKDGQLDKTYSSLVMYNGTWYNVINGVLDWSFNGIVLYNGTQYYIENGKIDWAISKEFYWKNKKYNIVHAQVMP